MIGIEHNKYGIDVYDTKSDELFIRFETPERAVAFAIKLSNLAYPLTKAVQRYTNGGCHR